MNKKEIDEFRNKKYLNHEIRFDKDYQTGEIYSRTGLGWGVLTKKRTFLFVRKDECIYNVFYL